MSLIQHKSVLLKESLEGLLIKPEGIYVDGTFGRGGHSREILKYLSKRGKLFAIDKDLEAVETGKQLEKEDPRFQIRHGSFTELKVWMDSLGLLRKIDGVLLDLGVSSPQLDDADRGFSFMRSGPLDMRMNRQDGESAADWIAVVKEEELAGVLKKYGDERYAKRIARAIIAARDEQSITTTGQLAEIIKKANPRWEKHIHPATRSFQAIRIYINKELDDLEIVLEDSLALLKSGGRLAVISFHSLEDRIVKHFIRDYSKSLGLPERFLTEEQKAKLKSIGKPIKTSGEEVERNIRSRSAVLRIAERI